MATADPGYNPTTLSGGGGSASLTETSGPTTLTLGSIADGLAVKRVGLELVGYAPGSATLTETSGPTTMTLGAIADGQTWKRVGTTVVGYTPGGATSLIETSGPTTLTLGAIADGQGIKRVGATAVGADYLTAAYIAIKSSVATLTARANLKFSSDFTVTDTAPDTVIALAGGGSGAPTNAQYLALAADATLTDERVFTAGAGLTPADAGAGGAYTLTSDAITGKAGGLTVTGGTGSGENLTLQSTAHATKGKVFIGAGTTAWVDAVAGNPRLVIDGTGLTTTVPALVKNAKSLSGYAVQPTVSTTSTGYTINDNTGTQVAAFGMVNTASDWIAGTGNFATGCLLWSSDKLRIKSSNAGGVGLVSPSGDEGTVGGAIITSSNVGTYMSFGTARVTCISSATTITGPLLISNSTSLSTVALAVTGDPNTGIAAVGGADTLSVVCGGTEQMRVSATALTLTPKISFFTAQTQATIGANGAAAALTALPLGYMKFDVNGTAVVVPYYNA